ncbi:MAG: hypothetical protein J6S94_01090, partial [Bacteroidaceae bacterium]|nr:hypothetical protein [Bacteroidaceae bacterium]
LLLFVSLLLISCSKDDPGDEQPQYDVTRWECILFGSYPANEVVNGSFNAVDDYALVEGDVIVNATLYNQLKHAKWTDDDTEIDGKRYHRLNAAGAVSYSDSHAQHYQWTDPEDWHYFAYAPIKWRILKQTGDKALLLADRMPDAYPFNDTYTDTNWRDCSLRQWLNSYFISRAFTTAEIDAIEVTDVKNDANYYFGTDCGPDTKDRVFVLSESETFSSPLAKEYGFSNSDSGNDPARRFRSTLYAKCRGAWWSPVEDYLGIAFWFMRTIGYTKANVVYVGETGDTYNRGIVVTCNDAAVLPAITLDLSKADYKPAEPVYSTDILK